MKKFSILFFAIIFILTPIFFSSATGEVGGTALTPGTLGTTDTTKTITPNNSSTSITLSSSNEADDGTTIKATGLTSNASYNIVIKNGTTVTQSSNPVVAGSDGKAQKEITDLSSGIAYTASIYSGSTYTGTALKTVPFSTTKSTTFTSTLTVAPNSLTSDSVELVAGGIPVGAFSVKIMNASTDEVEKTYSDPTGENTIFTISGLKSGTTYTAALYLGTQRFPAAETGGFDTKLLIGTLTNGVITSNSAKIDVGFPKGTEFFVYIKYKSAADNDYISGLTASGTTDDNGKASVIFNGLSPNTEYVTKLAYDSHNNITTYPFKTEPEPLIGTLTISTITSTSAKINVELLKNTAFAVYIKKSADPVSEYINTFTAHGTTDDNGTASVTFNNLIPDTTYITMLASGTFSNIDTYEFTASAELNYFDLFKNVRGAVDKIANEKEGNKPGDYLDGSKTQLSLVLNERYSNSGELLDNKGFTLQSEIDAFNTKLQAAIVVFEKRKVGAATIGGDMSSIGGGLVPDCLKKGGCGFDELMTLINNLITFLLFTVATPLAAIIIAYAGWLYLKSGGNPGDITKAKKILLNVVIGYIIGLAAWLIVKTIVSSLGVDPTINTFLK